MSPEKEKWFDKQEELGLALTFDDVRIVTGPSNYGPSEVNLESRFSRKVDLKVPMVSAAMDTVTESSMAIAMAKLGGLGVIHAGLDIATQKEEVRRVKLHLNGRIEKPISYNRDYTISQVLEDCDKKRFDFRTFPVVDKERKLVGMLTTNDFEFCEDNSQKVEDVMTPLAEIVSAPNSTEPEAAYDLMKENKKKTLPLINNDGTVAGLYILSDVLRVVRENPDKYNLDDKGSLIVGAAVPTNPEEAVNRVKAMENYLDVIVLDSAQGDSKYAQETLKVLKEGFDIDVVVGNVSSPVSAKLLAELGADGIKVGQGPGSICTTRTETGIGTPQVTAVNRCIRAVDEDLPVCADGGITNPGDISIAIAAGAHSVMMGGMLAATKETPGKEISVGGSIKKVYRGMGSEEALRESDAARKRYGDEDNLPDPEGVSQTLQYRGSVVDVVSLYVRRLRKSMSYSGAKDIENHRNITMLDRITGSGLRESHPHSVSTGA